MICVACRALNTKTPLKIKRKGGGVLPSVENLKGAVWEEEVAAFQRKHVVREPGDTGRSGGKNERSLFKLGHAVKNRHDHMLSSGGGGATRS